MYSKIKYYKMKNLFCLILCSIFIIISCKKHEIEIDNPETQITVKQIVDTAVGKYLTTRFCSSGSSVGGYTYDTAYNVILEVEKENDSTLIIEGIKLPFNGSIEYKYYQFHLSASGGGHNFRIDSTFTKINFGYWFGGLGGGSGCQFIGIKQ
jgi:hypothetical protein